MELHQAADSGAGVGELQEGHLFVGALRGQEPEVHDSAATFEHLLQFLLRYFRSGWGRGFSRRFNQETEYRLY